MKGKEGRESQGLCLAVTYISAAQRVTLRPSLRQWAGSRVSFLQSIKSSARVPYSQIMRASSQRFEGRWCDVRRRSARDARISFLPSRLLLLPCNCSLARKLERTINLPTVLPNRETRALQRRGRHSQFVDMGYRAGKRVWVDVGAVFEVGGAVGGHFGRREGIRYGWEEKEVSGGGG